MNSKKREDNLSRLRSLKLAKLKAKEAELKFQINNRYDEKTIAQTMRDIESVKKEIQKLN